MTRQNPVFLAGMARSGTNYVFEVLESLQYFQGYNEDREELFENFHLKSNDNLEQIIDSLNNRVILVKIIADLVRIHELRKRFPDSAFIILYRNPLDVTRSHVAEFTDQARQLNHVLNFDFYENNLATSSGRRWKLSRLRHLLDHFAGRFSFSHDYESKIALLWLLHHVFLVDSGVLELPNVALAEYDEVCTDQRSFLEVVADRLSIPADLKREIPESRRRPFFFAEPQIDGELREWCLDVYREYEEIRVRRSLPPHFISLSHSFSKPTEPDDAAAFVRTQNGERKVSAEGSDNIVGPCPVCDLSNLRPFSRLSAGSEGGRLAYTCANCGSIIPEWSLDIERPIHLARQDVYRTRNGRLPFDLRQEVGGMVDCFQELNERMGGELFPKGARVLVAGSGNGKEIRALRDSKCFAAGFDISSRLVAAARQGMGLSEAECYVASAEDVMARDHANGKLDAIIFWHSFTLLWKPLDVMGNAIGHLCDGGHLLLQMPLWNERNAQSCIRFYPTEATVEYLRARTTTQIGLKEYDFGAQYLTVVLQKPHKATSRRRALRQLQDGRIRASATSTVHSSAPRESDVLQNPSDQQNEDGDIGNLDAELDRKDEVIDEILRRNEELEAAIASQVVLLAELRQEFAKQSGELAEVREDLSEREEECGRVRAELDARANAEGDRIQAALAEADAAVNSLREHLATREAAARADSEELGAALGQARSDGDAREAALRAEAVEYRARADELQETLLQARNDSDARQAALQTEAEEYRARTDELQEALTQAREDCDAREARLRTEAEQLRAKTAELQQALTRARSDGDEREAALRTEAGQLRTALAATRHEAAAQEAAAQSEMDGLRSALTQAQSELTELLSARSRHAATFLAQRARTEANEIRDWLGSKG